jgi:hypothetical protein
MNGQEWQTPSAFIAIQSLAPSLPHLKPLLVAFFKEAAETWKRFTSEFAPEGLIDEASQEERDLAWMLPTNDINEGVLGSFHVMMHWQPQLTLLGYNAQAMFFHNDTEAFIKKFFVEPEDYKFLHSMAWQATAEDKKRRLERSQSFQHSREREHVRNLVYSGGTSKMQYKYSKYRLYTTGVTCDTGITCDTRTDDVRDTLTKT